MLTALASSATWGPGGSLGDFRYRLDRTWGDGPRLCWIGLNPSTADAFVDDPTIRRCVGFTKREGGGALTMLNVCAFRSTAPRRLLEVADPVGAENARAIAEALADAHAVIAAWGAHAKRPWLERALALIASRQQLLCLGTTRGGAPRHPLYVRADTPLTPWKAPWTAGTCS